MSLTVGGDVRSAYLSRAKVCEARPMAAQYATADIPFDRIAPIGRLGVDFWMTHGEYIFKLTAVFPILSVILDFLAARGILADQLLVESAYHLRKSRRDRRK